MLKRLLLAAVLLVSGVAARAHEELIPIWVVFGHNASYFLPPSGLTTDTPYEAPSESNYFFMSYWFNSTTDPSGNDTFQHVMFEVNNSSNYGMVLVQHEYETGIAATRLQVAFTSSDGAHSIVWSTGSDCYMQYNGQWHQVMITANTNDIVDYPHGNIVKVVYDGTACSMIYDGDTTADFNIPWSGVTSGYQLLNQGGSSAYRGTIAEIYVDGNDWQDLTSDTIAKYRTAGGKAVGLGEFCETPTGLIPMLCQRGNPLHIDFGPFTGTPPTPAYIMDAVGTNLPYSALGDPCDTPGFGPGCL